ncbi:type VI secretion protein [Erythrobacter sp. F6033]|uniref:type VI secretion protein n=1 Tax=Erythrobacter sp. F6033 TaxID=2926401 RepID=UPI001FF16BB9|nr:type VI secretion protein [Erythrobacter sp. F6033]MCK0129094.1 type VI secretion protein [Erythrobacter sp. F6033]
MFASSAAAQSEDTASDGANLDGLKVCQKIADNAERLACFDNAVGQIVTATETGELTVINKEDAKKTRRSLFGFALPDIGIFGGGDDEEDELFETTITSARYLSGKKIRFTTAEGAVWEMKNVPRRLQQIKSGDKAVFKQASMGTFFVRINGQLGVRGKRVE